MTSVFADASYWIALLRGDDQWHEAALLAQERLGEARIVTTDEVLTEVLTGLSRHGWEWRTRAVGVVRDILAHPGVRVIPQTHETFLEGVSRYDRRPDKGYSLQDCISMNVMEAEGITKILTSDRHFEQEGFTILMKASP